MITITRKPDPFSFVYNPMVFDIISDNISEDYFSYLVGLDIRGQRVANLKIPCRPNTYNGVFDIQRFLQDEVGYDLDMNMTFSLCPNSFATYSLTFDEMYLERTNFDQFIENGSITHGGVLYSGHMLHFTASTTNIVTGDYIQLELDPLGASYSYLDALYGGRNYVSKVLPDYVILQSNTNTGSKSYTINSQAYLSSLALSTLTTGVSFSADGYNGTLNYLDYLDMDYSEYIVPSLTKSILTTMPNNFELTYDDYLYLNFYQNLPESLAIVGLQIVSNNGRYSLINPEDYRDPMNDSFCRVLKCGCGPSQLLSGTSSLYKVSGKYPVIDENTTQIELYLINIMGFPISNSLTYKIDRRCSYNKKYTILFKDKFNSFCSYTFNLKNIKNNTYERTRYKKRFMVETFTDVIDAGNQIIEINKNTTYTVYSDYLTQTQYDYLMEIFESPAVFLLHNDKWVSISILNGGVEHLQSINGDLLYITLNFELSYREENQRT